VSDRLQTELDTGRTLLGILKPFIDFGMMIHHILDVGGGGFEFDYDFPAIQRKHNPVFLRCETAVVLSAEARPVTFTPRWAWRE